MKTFNEFNKKLSRKFVSIYYDEETSDKLREYCYENGIDLTKDFDDSNQAPEEFDFHTTIFFSSNESSIPESNQRLNESIVFPDHFEMLGLEKNILVLKVKSATIRGLRTYYEELGLEDTWPLYKPHVTLSYNKEIKYDLTRLEIPKFELVFNRLVVKDIKE